MGQQSAASQESEHTRSPKTKSQRTHIRFTTSNMIDSLRPTVNTSTSIFKPPASPRGNAGNRRLSQTRSNLTLSQQQFRQQQRSRRTSQFFNFAPLSQQPVGTSTQDFLQESSQDEEEKESWRSSLTSTSGRRSGRRVSPGQAGRSTTPPTSGLRPQDNTPKGSLKPVSPPSVTQEWPTRTQNTADDEDGSGEDEEESPSRAVSTRPSPQTATRYYTQSLSPSPRRSSSQPDEVDTHIPSTDPQQHQPNSLGLSQLVCGQRMPAFSPTPNARSSTQTQPYDGFAEVDYQEDLPEFFDDNDNNGGNMVAEDSLAGTSGEALSWSVTPQRGVEADAVEVKQEVPHSVQKDIIPSTFPSRMSKSRSQPEAEEESVEEELFERCMGSISPEVESESHDDTNTRKQQPSSSSTSSQKFVISRHNIFKTSHDSAKTRRMKTYGKQGRGRGRLSIPDHVKRQLNKDTLDLISHTPSVQQVFLCVEIPIVPEIGSKSHTPLKAKAKAPELGPGPGRKRAAEGSSKRKTKLTSLQPPPPPLPPKSARQSAGQKRKQSNIQRRSSRRAGAHRSGTYYEKTFSDDYDEEEEDEHKSEDKSGGDELEVIAVSPSVNPRPIRTHLLPPKKRIRPHVAFQKDSLPPSQDQQRHQPGPRILHDSDSDGEQAPRNVQRRRTSGVRLPSTSPATAQEQEQEYEQEQDLDQDMQRSPSPRPSASGQGDEKGRRQASDAEGRDDEEQGQGTAQRWEVTKLQNMWKEHGIRWPLRRGQGQEEYNTYFVFGSALPLPK